MRFIFVKTFVLMVILCACDETGNVRCDVTTTARNIDEQGNPGDIQYGNYHNGDHHGALSQADADKVYTQLNKPLSPNEAKKLWDAYNQKKADYEKAKAENASSSRSAPDKPYVLVPNKPECHYNTWAEMWHDKGPLAPLFMGAGRIFNPIKESGSLLDLIFEKVYADSGVGRRVVFEKKALEEFGTSPLLAASMAKISRVEATSRELKGEVRATLTLVFKNEKTVQFEADRDMNQSCAFVEKYQPQLLKPTIALTQKPVEGARAKENPLVMGPACSKELLSKMSVYNLYSSSGSSAAEPDLVLVIGKSADAPAWALPRPQLVGGVLSPARLYTQLTDLL